MNLALFIVLLGLLFKMVSGKIECGSENLENKEKLQGCQFTNLNAIDYTIQMEKYLKKYDVTATNYSWLNFNKTNFINGIIPNEIFQDFKAMREFEIQLSKGLQTVRFMQGENLRSLYIISSDLETLDEFSFVKLENLKTLILNHNQIKSIHRRSFKNLRILEDIEIVNNSLTHLNPITFHNNLKLKSINLKSNKIKVILNDLFKLNINLVNIQLMNNQISFMERCPFATLNKLEKIDLTSNLCINQKWRFKKFVNWCHFSEFETCFKSIENKVFITDVIAGENVETEKENQHENEIKEIKNKLHINSILIGTFTTIILIFSIIIILTISTIFIIQKCKPLPMITEDQLITINEISEKSKDIEMII